jgi:hypothetical protein
MIRVALLLLVVYLSGAAMAEEIFIHSYSPVSARLAILDDNQRVAYLYLTARGTQKPERDVIAYTRVAPTTTPDWAEMAKNGDAPLLPKEFASPVAVIPAPVASEFSFKWSRDGVSVALLRNGQPIAFASLSDRLGYSKAVAKSGALANAWSQERYDKIFGKP